MPIVRAGGMIWAPVCKELDWEQLIPHKPDKQLSDGSDVNLLLTVGGGDTFDADPDVKDCLSHLWWAEPSNAFCTIFIANRKHA